MYYLKRFYTTEDLPESILRQSPTWLRSVDACGQCSRCGEHASLLSPCCGSSLYFEGGSEYFGDLWDEIEAELDEKAIF